MSLGWTAQPANSRQGETACRVISSSGAFAEQLAPTKDGVEGINRINEEEGVAWIISFLSADKRKTYCLYEAPNPGAIRAAARRNNIPVRRHHRDRGRNRPQHVRLALRRPSSPAGEPLRLCRSPIRGEPLFPHMPRRRGRGEGRGGERRGGDGEEFGARPRSGVATGNRRIPDAGR